MPMSFEKLSNLLHALSMVRFPFLFVCLFGLLHLCGKIGSSCNLLGPTAPVLAFAQVQTAVASMLQPRLSQLADAVGHLGSDVECGCWRYVQRFVTRARYCLPSCLYVCLYISDLFSRFAVATQTLTNTTTRTINFAMLELPDLAFCEVLVERQQALNWELIVRPGVCLFAQSSLQCNATTLVTLDSSRVSIGSVGTTFSTDTDVLQFAVQSSGGFFFFFLKKFGCLCVLCVYVCVLYVR